LDDIDLEAHRFFQLKDEEQFSAIGLWSEIRSAHKLVIVTNRGFARAYGINGLIEQVEGPTPVQFDQPLPGVPAAVFGTQKEAWLLVALDSARAVRIRVADFPTRGLQVIRRRDDEILAGALVVQLDDELVILTASGYGRRLAVQDFPESSKPNSPGRVLLSQKPLVALAKCGPGNEMQIVTNRQLASFFPGDFPLSSDNSTRSYKLFKPEIGEQISSFLAS
jgi:DNA gyrase/topoisomerase IV subunit A